MGFIGKNWSRGCEQMYPEVVQFDHQHLVSAVSQ
uniref:Uncharacterized protein n=1 Tax=Arundo donax TaxID=35708 RepID=A0A0A8ZZ64_ARUDO